MYRAQMYIYLHYYEGGRMNAVALHDRTGFEDALAKLPADTPLALALADIDSFKELNDENGREAGDAVLRSVERTLTSSIPADAVAGRLGGDEYAVALPRATAEGALILMEEIRSHLDEREGIHVSIGIAAQPQHARGAATLMRAADEALFRAKREGRARVAIYVEDRMTLKSNYYSKAALERLSKLSTATGRTEASLLREALDDLFVRYGDEL
jgi:diguanylate cyclase (GGDEF)-like protein